MSVTWPRAINIASQLTSKEEIFLEDPGKSSAFIRANMWNMEAEESVRVI